MPDDKPISAPANLSHDTQCLNCGTRFDGRYCPECGQKYDTARLTWRKLLDNLVYGLTNLDRGWVKTIAALFTRPGKMIREYIGGRRVVYTNPFPMLVVLCGIYGFISVLMSRSAREIAEKFVSDGEALDLTATMIEWSFGHMLVLMLAMLPVTAFYIRLLFRKSALHRYNYTEMLFMAAFISCQYMIFTIAAIPAEYFLWQSNITAYSMAVSLVIVFLMAWCCRGFFNVGWFQSIWKSVLVLILSYVTVVLITSLVLVAVVTLLFDTHMHLKPDNL